MTAVTLYHNPRCSKSRTALRILEESGAPVRIIRYLDTPLTIAGLKKLTNVLRVSPRALLRTKEAAYKDLKLANPDLTDADILEAIVAHPKLLERPIAVCGDQGVIGRPPELVLDILPKNLS